MYSIHILPETIMTSLYHEISTREQDAHWSKPSFMAICLATSDLRYWDTCRRTLCPGEKKYQDTFLLNGDMSNPKQLSGIITLRVMTKSTANFPHLSIS